MNSDNFVIETEALQSRVKESELFTKRFGSFAKADYEILMFTVYLDSLKGYVRDYDISIALGITESKVRNLRIKSQLLYPREIDWIQELKNAIIHGYYDITSRQITIVLEDPSVKNLLKSKVEENFGMVGLTLNAKQMVLPLESFLMLAAISEPNADSIIKELNNLLNKEAKVVDKIEKNSLKNRFLQRVPNALEFINSALSIYSVGKPILDALIQIMK